MAPGRDGLIFVRDIADPEVADVMRFGGKASGLSRMAAAGVPVPPAFVIGAEGYKRFRANGEKLGGELIAEVARALQGLEAATDKTFRGIERPLLVSVRSGAAVSMPGMMDTVLNLGLTAHSAFALARASGAPDFALDTWLRFWRMFSDTVLDLDSSELADAVRDPETRAREAYSQEAFVALEQAILDHVDQGMGRPVIAAIQWSSSNARLRPCFVPGIAPARRPIGGIMAFPMTWAPRSLCRRWCSETRTRIPVRASRSRAIPTTETKALYGEYFERPPGRGPRLGDTYADRPFRSERIGQRPSTDSNRDGRDSRGALSRRGRHRIHDRIRQTLPTAGQGRKTDGGRGDPNRGRSRRGGRVDARRGGRTDKSRAYSQDVATSFRRRCARGGED